MPGPRLPSPTEAEVLRRLIAGGESYGLALVNTSEGQLKRGTVYVTLDRMEDKGFVESRLEDEPIDDYIGIRRRLYRVTGFGARALAALEMSHAQLVGAGHSS
jgi:PadR family transcriptional regulator PadR